MLYKNFELHVVTYSNWVIKYRYLVVLISLLLAAVCLSGIRYLELPTDYRAFFSKENPQLIAFEALQDTFSKNDNIFFILRRKIKQPDGIILDSGPSMRINDLYGKFLDEILRVAEQVPSKQVWVCSGSSHLEGYKTDTDNYEKVLFKFLKDQVAIPK